MRLDVEKLESRIKKVVSTEEALQDVEPFHWDDDILSGERRGQAMKKEENKNKKTVTLEPTDKILEEVLLVGEPELAGQNIVISKKYLEHRLAKSE